MSETDVDGLSDTEVDHPIAAVLSGVSRAEADQAEKAAAQLMRKIGFSDATATVSSGDHGIDVRATAGLAQVKWQSKPVGRPAVQQLGGAWLREQSLWKRNTKMLFFSKSGYTSAAVDYADAVGMVLFEFDLKGRATAVGKAAMSYRKKYPEVVRNSATSRHSPTTGRWRRISQETLVALAVVLVVAVSLAPLVVGLYFAYVAVAGMIAGPTTGTWVALAGGTALIVAFAIIARWLLTTPE
ncbi:restriction endonuclease [Gordonia sp. UCD-TK1]|uniref:restriction endonuclease n=1 Tax=Gordonia sp. UCD-TK1 TaxID=1857893 RepID=UPI001586E975|nr:restriction endonuclease [Gordonia sp. UCD-TK1]